MTDLEAIASELSAFADDDQEVAVDQSGEFLIARGGRDLAGRFFEDAGGEMRVEVDGTILSYRKFVTHHLARLDVFAERILAKRSAPAVFIDGAGTLNSASHETTTGPASDLLRGVCAEGSPFATRVVFVTADAGHGKTVLLRELQHRQAQDFLDGKAQSLFWHVDLQGRQLVRLSEALMGDLGDLRVAGLWMPAILRLIRMRALVLAIDGFDELAAEQGSSDALGALATLVQQLEGKGVVVAASRRTFFDTEDYLARAGLIRRSVAAACQFDQLSLQPWSEQEAIALFSAVSEGGDRLADPAGSYTATLAALGGDSNHPMLTRPFLVSQLARALIRYGIEPAAFVRGMDDPLKGVAALVKAFVDREVTDKWIHRETGEPYLSAEQHMELLAAVAEEMYQAQKDRLRLDMVETIATLLLEQWGIDHERRVQVLQMVRMHVLLTVPADGAATMRSFDHTEFRDYFVAVALQRLLDAQQDGGQTALASMLRIAQISDSTARYVCGMLDLAGPKAGELAQTLAQLCRNEPRVTFIPLNVGTLLPFVLDSRVGDDEPVVVDAPAVFASLVFERTVLRNVTFRNCNFLNASLIGVDWTDIRLEHCALGELTIDLAATARNVILEDCDVAALRVLRSDGEIAREYAPTRIRAALEEAGFAFPAPPAEMLPFSQVEDSAYAKLVRRVLRMFQRSTVINDLALQQRFRQDFNTVVDEVFPQLESHSIVERRAWHGAGSQRVWGLTVPLDSVLASEEPDSGSPLHTFWTEVRGR